MLLQLAGKRYGGQTPVRRDRTRMTGGEEGCRNSGCKGATAQMVNSWERSLVSDCRKTRINVHLRPLLAGGRLARADVCECRIFHVPWAAFTHHERFESAALNDPSRASLEISPVRNPRAIRYQRQRRHEPAE